MKSRHSIFTSASFMLAGFMVCALGYTLLFNTNILPDTRLPELFSTASTDASYVTALHDAQWRRTRNHFIRIQDDCQMCGADKQLQVHHVLPWHLYPELRYSHANLITLCQPCHFRFGHGRNWQAYNPDITNLILLVAQSLTNTVYRATQ